MKLRLLIAAALVASCGPPARPPADAGPGTRDAAADAPADSKPDSASPSPDTAPPTLLPASVAAIAGELHGAFLELECQSEEIEFQFCVPKDMGKRTLTLKFGGEPGKSYAVELAVWGVMETIKYKDGTLAGEHFYTGGSPETPMTAEYGLEIGGQTYFLNYQDIGAGEHYTYGIQYQSPAITIPGRSTITLFVRDPDNFVNTNHMQSEVADPPPKLREQLRRIMAETVQGQFVYVEVKSAVAK
jgi:hypothetical protein